jgi:metal-dependent amidase/aminoacylase/carboxypeptidase family protein
MHRAKLTIAAAACLLAGGAASAATQPTDALRMCDIFYGITKAAHATFELSFDTGHPMTVNNPELTAELVPIAMRLMTTLVVDYLESGAP